MNKEELSMPKYLKVINGNGWGYLKQGKIYDTSIKIGMVSWYDRFSSLPNDFKESTKEAYDMQNSTPNSPMAKEYIYKDSLNKENKPLKLEDLKEGVVLVSLQNITLEVQGCIGSVIFCTDNNYNVLYYSINQILDEGYTIKQPEPVVPEKKYYLGFEVRNYEGEGIIVSLSDKGVNDCKDVCRILKEVKKDCIVDIFGNNWKYAVLITCNNHEQRRIIMTNNEAKQNAIKEAYGDYFERCKPDEDGWSYEKQHFNICTLFFCMNSEQKTYGDVPNNYMKCWRPKSLSGIEDNNGWIKNESEEDLPKEYGYYWAIDNSELIQEVNSDDIKVGFYTHYQPIIYPKPPLY